MSHLLTVFFRQETHKKTAGVKRDYNRLGNQSIRSLVKWILRWATDPQVGVRFSQDRPYYGVVAQLGEQLLCKQKVVGSIPSSSTRFCPFS